MLTAQGVFTAGYDPEVVRAWIADDPDAQTRAELQALLTAAEAAGTDQQAARAELEDRFSAPLTFGTAGLRGALGAGPQRMNRAVVIRAAAGLTTFLAETLGPEFSVVIGCDARYGSADFARDTAAVVTAAGGRALLLPAQLPTPLLAFALTELGCDAGVMVTASHNPPQDNGYKVYLGARPIEAHLQAQGIPADDAAAEARAGGGAQIVPPFDALIAERIAAVESVAATPRAHSGWECVEDSIVEDYLSAIEELGRRLDARLSAPVRVVLTSLHGVGGQTMRAALARAGFEDVHEVAVQAQPDPAFPTVAFPNPEEAGALDAALALAAEVGADLILANDPDADRVSAAVPSAAGWRQLSGDEVGLLLGEHIAGWCDRMSAAEPADSAAPADAAEPADSAAQRPQRVLANSIVSSRALGAVARAHGLEHAATLTGFKWISRVPGVVFGYEEALGYCVDPEVVRDKDGISAGVVFASLVSALAARGQTVDDELARIRERDGVFLTQPLTFRLTDTSLIAAAMEKLRSTAPRQLAGQPVTEVVDLATGSAELPPTDGILLLTAAGDRVIIRPSGTEPKLKCYLEAVGEAAAAEAAADRLTQMRADLSMYFGL